MVYNNCSMSILHFRRELDRPPAAVDVPDICVRNMRVPDDVTAWLELRDRAMADERPRARPWSDSDFHSEMLSKPWWRPTRSWVAIAGEPRSPDEAGTAPLPATRRSPAIDSLNTSQLVGAVTLALREGASRTVPVVHWLFVDPAWRRRGIAHFLMQHLEKAAYDDGWRDIELETHAGWAAAVGFYQSIGYELVRDRSVG